ncbi:hypothetical protein BOTBODRAFT_106211, partial [Botryobasidium botryosum FD-172 SS1]
GTPCDENGVPLPLGAPPPPRLPTSEGSPYAPFSSRVAFETAELLFKKIQMSEGDINEILELWAASLVKHNDNAPFHDAKDLYAVIDAIKVGNTPWQCMITSYEGVRPESNVPSWMCREYHIWYWDPLAVLCNMLANPDFKGKVDVAPFREFLEGKREWQDFMSGNWAWRKVDEIVKDLGLESVEGAALVPIILGSDKTTVSVATGQNNFYPLYLSFGNAHNELRRLHCGTLLPIAFLAMPKSAREHDGDLGFHKFRQQLFHSSVSHILSTLKPGMLAPIVMCWPDGHFRRSIFNLVLYIADYPEQALVGSIVNGWCAVCTAHSNDLDGTPYCKRCREHTDFLVSHFGPEFLWESYGIPFTNDFPRADIHKMMAPDILHQIIKGCFLDHLVTWVSQYLERIHGKPRAAVILDDIDLWYV